LVSDPLVSVFIRVRDEAAALGQVVRLLADQDIDASVETVVLDNESVDGSRSVALDAGARVFSLPRQHFGYGRALNLGMELCRGEIAVLLSAHAVPQSRTWLGELIEPLRDGTVGAAFCRQIPPSRVSRLELRRFACFPAADTIIDRDRFLAQCEAGADPYEAAIFSNSACAIRRDVAARLPFRDLPYAEDRAFVVDYLMSGGAVAYRHGPSVSYERHMTWRTAYRIGYRAQVSKRLIRELAATYTGRRFDSGPETASRLMRAVLVLPAVAARMLMCLREPRGHRRRAVIHVLRSTGATLGLAKGSFYWRRHMETLSPDPERLLVARGHCAPVARDAGDVHI
jgi:glycosyltransferase involved in cell wall biosynthesis